MADYPHGMPAWVELSTADGDAAASFYGDLFGWQSVSGGPPEETGGYRMFMQDGKAIAGLMAQDGVPTAWATYFSVDDADTAAAQIGEAGGTTQVAPIDVMDLGRMGFFTDPAGALFGIWEARSFSGTEVEPGTPGARCWSELVSSNVDEAKSFYSHVFHWAPEPAPFSSDYTMWKSGDTYAGAMSAIDGPFAAPGSGARWDVIFAVADVDAFTARAASLGATIAVPPTDIPPGRAAALVDPLGASFQVINPVPMPS
jgi:uncharacterized protein